jgi:predicted permease
MRAFKSILQDLHYALRSLRSSKGLTTVAVVSLALGIGTTIAIFSIANALLIKKLPVQDPDHLVELVNQSGGNRHRDAEWKELRARQDIFSGMLAYEWFNDAFDLKEKDETRRIEGLYVSGDFFETLGLSPTLGRLLEPSDDQTGAAPVCVIGYSFWRQEYAQSSSIVGQAVILDGRPVQVVGIAPPHFFGLDATAHAEVFVPIQMERTYQPRPVVNNVWANIKESQTLNVAGRLKSGVSVAQADDRLHFLNEDVQKVLPPRVNRLTGQQYPMQILAARPMPHGTRDPQIYFGETVLLLLIMASVVLVIACTNLGNLLLARSTRRRAEISTRFALGATRWRVVRQLLIESLALALTGTAAGLLVEHWASKLVLSWISFFGGDLFMDLSWDPKLVAFTVAMPLLCALLFGLAPALRATHLSLYSAMKSDAPTGWKCHKFSEGMLVVAQVALSTGLFVTAGLLTRTLHALAAQDLGYESKGVLTIDGRLDSADQSPQQKIFIADELLSRLRSEPDVISASRGTAAGHGAMPMITVSQPDGSQRRYRAYLSFSSSDFFKTRHTPILVGRDFNRDDTPASPRVAILSEQAAKVFFPGANPLGGTYRENDEENGSHDYPVQVIGVAKDINLRRPSDPPQPMVFRPTSQCPDSCGLGRYEVKFAGPLAVLAKRLNGLAASVDPRLSLSSRPTDRRNRFARPTKPPHGLARNLLRLARGRLGVDRRLWSDLLRHVAAHPRNWHPHGTRRTTRQRATHDPG